VETNPANARLNLSYLYQNNGNISQVTDRTGSETLTYTYDELDRLDVVSGPYRDNFAGFLAMEWYSLPYDRICKKEVTMERDRVLAILKSRKQRLKKFGIHSLSIFGSVARDQAHKDSDVDILVDFEKPIGLFEYARLKMYLEEILERPVDLVTPEALRQEMREEILHEAIRAA
jgi:uncharacterized protein